MGGCNSQQVEEILSVVVEIIALLPNLQEQLPKSNEERLVKLNSLMANKKKLDALQQKFLKYVSQQVDKQNAELFTEKKNNRPY